MKTTDVRIDFSLRREVFFVVIGSIIGAATMVVPKTIFETALGLPYYLTWIAFGHILGIYSSASILAGIAIHIITAISIGTVVGIFLYKSGILNISKISNGLLYGLFAGSVVFGLFFIPAHYFVLTPEIANTLTQMDPTMTQAEAIQQIRSNIIPIWIGSIIMHLVFGVTLGIVSSLLSIKFGSKYRCAKCDISFSRIDSLQKHGELVHGAKPIQLKRILILGGGFAGVTVLRELQEAFQNDVSVDITLVSKDNFLLFTPMLPEASSGMIETRHIVTPVRTFCKRARFYEATVESIDLNNKQVVITHAIGKQTDPMGWRSHTLRYDYLVLAIGGETNYFGLTEVAKHAFTIKTLGDAIVLRNHVINMLEQADVENEDKELRRSLMTFVIVGGGFSGVETVGELNDLVRESIEHFYHNIDSRDVKVVLVNAGTRVLPEVTEDLSEFALQKLTENGVEVLSNTRVVGCTKDSVKLHDGTVIPTHTLIWAGGVTPDKLIASLPCDHDKGGRIIANNYMEVQGVPNIYTLGDCASITDPNTNKPYPPTAQHALRQARVAANNIVSAIKGGKKVAFTYKTKGMMALIGKRNGVGLLLGHRVHGFPAWCLWRSYYWSNLPTMEKKVRVMVDWVIDMLFKRDVTRLRTFTEENSVKIAVKEAEVLR